MALATDQSKRVGCKTTSFARKRSPVSKTPSSSFEVVFKRDAVKSFRPSWGSCAHATDATRRTGSMTIVGTPEFDIASVWCHHRRTTLDPASNRFGRVCSGLVVRTCLTFEGVAVRLNACVGALLLRRVYEADPEDCASLAQELTDAGEKVLLVLSQDASAT